MNARLPMPQTLPPALQGFTAFNQWLNYRLTPQPGGKLKKEAIGREGYRVDPTDPARWMSYAEAAATGLPLAFSFSESDPFFFLDIDNGLSDSGEWSSLAQSMCTRFAGCAIEVSSSGRGLHIFGVGNCERHSNRRDDIGIEFYTRGRFVALTGNMLTPDGSVFHSPTGLPALVAEYFPPSQHTAATDWTDGPCEGWAGPTDDAELIRRASRHVSAAAAFAGKASFADLWAGDADALAASYPSSTGPYDASSADAALCAHLAYWTGKDCERMARLLRESGLARDKHDREDYVQRTVLSACGLVGEVLQDRPQTVIDQAARTEGYAFGSDDYLAALFVSAAKNRFRWSDQLGWMYKRTHHWEPERAAAYRAMTEICKQVAKAEEAHKMGPRLGANKTKNDALAAASNALELYTPLDRWDCADMLICTPAGVYDLETGALVEDREHLFTTVTAVAPRCVPTPIWDKFLMDVFGGDAEMIAFIHRLCGYLITGSVEEQKLFFFYGSTGGNGKSVLMDTLRDILSGYACRLPTDALMASFNERHPTSLASLRGKRLATSSEADAKKSWNEPLLKELTGEATLTARKMRQDDFEFRQTQKHVIMGNSRPKLRGEDGGIARRFVLVEFKQTFTGERRDNSLRQKLKAEYSGILFWLIEGAKLWRSEGLQVPVEVQDSSSQYMDDQNDIKRWVDENCTVVAGHKEAGALLLSSFRAFKTSSGEAPPGDREFYERLRSAGYTSERGRKGVVFIGLRVRQM